MASIIRQGLRHDAAKFFKNDHPDNPLSPTVPNASHRIAPPCLWRILEQRV